MHTCKGHTRRHRSPSNYMLCNNMLLICPPRYLMVLDAPVSDGIL